MKKFTLLIVIAILFQGCAMVTLTPKIKVAASQSGAEILITKLYTHHPNSAGGVDVSASYHNISDKSLKYVFIEIEPYNAVHDKQICSIKSKSKILLKDTGPIEPGATGGGVWACVWYNYSIKYLKIIGLELIFIDNTKVTIKDKNTLNKYLLSAYQ